LQRRKIIAEIETELGRVFKLYEEQKKRLTTA
jgi:hypothetical protein